MAQRLIITAFYIKIEINKEVFYYENISCYWHQTNYELRRLGIRDSLEEKVAQMAAQAKALIEQNVFYADGTPAKVIIFLKEALPAVKKPHAVRLNLLPRCNRYFKCELQAGAILWKPLILILLPSKPSGVQWHRTTGGCLSGCCHVCSQPDETAMFLHLWT